jgi:hypothetical protein
MLFVYSNIWQYDIATNVWTDVTPVALALPSDYVWTKFHIKGWMAVYDPVTDAHYVREGADESPSDPGYNEYNNTEYVKAGRVRKVQFTDAAPTRFSTLTHAGGIPFNRQDSGCKHLTFLYSRATDELIQCGGDFYAGNVTQPNGKVLVLGSTRRDMWASHPVAAKNGTGQLVWSLVQPEFTPNNPDGTTGLQGPGGPDQVWFVQRSNGEFWVLPGAYRYTQYEDDPSVGMDVQYRGDHYHAMQWTRTQSYNSYVYANNKAKVYVGSFTDGTTQIARATQEPDKFAAYDATTDTAYCINDTFEIVKFPFTTKDWVITPLGMPSVDDSGNSLAGTSQMSIGGSLQAMVDRKVYALGLWLKNDNTSRSYLCWYNVDTAARGMIPLPFDLDPHWVSSITPPSDPHWADRNPEEGTGLVAIHRKLVMMKTMYSLVSAGTPCIWVYDVDRKTFTQAPAPTVDVAGDAWCAIPTLDSVIFLGNEWDATYSPNLTMTDSRAWLYRIV